MNRILKQCTQKRSVQLRRKTHDPSSSSREIEKVEHNNKEPVDSLFIIEKSEVSIVSRQKC